MALILCITHFQNHASNQARDIESSDTSASTIANAINSLSQLSSTMISAVGNANAQLINVHGNTNKLDKSLQSVQKQLGVIYDRQEWIYRHITGVPKDELGDFPKICNIPVQEITELQHVDSAITMSNMPKGLPVIENPTGFVIKLCNSKSEFDSQDAYLLSNPAVQLEVIQQWGQMAPIFKKSSKCCAMARELLNKIMMPVLQSQFNWTGSVPVIASSVDQVFRFADTAHCKCIYQSLIIRSGQFGNIEAESQILVDLKQEVNRNRQHATRVRKQLDKLAATSAMPKDIFQQEVATRARAAYDKSRQTRDRNKVLKEANRENV